MKYLNLFFMLLTTAWALPSFAQLPMSLKDKSDLTFEDLKEFVDNEKNEALTIDKLLPKLPNQMLQNPLLVYESHALNLDRVGPSTPRVILFNKDASLIISFTKQLSAQKIEAGEDSLEVLSFNPSSQLFEMFEVAFDGNKKPFARAEDVNPAKCLACHGSNPRPIFHDYNAWPGFYGSFSQKGVAVGGTLEHQLLSDFLSKREALPRYRDLVLDRVTRGSLGIGFPSTGFGPLYDDKQFSPALAFGVNVELLMYRRLAQKLEDDKKAKRFAHLIAYLGRADECLGDRTLHRRATKELFKTWVNSESLVKNAATLTAQIEKEVRADFVTKDNLLRKFNLPDKRLDPRGLITLPYETVVLGSPSWTTVDKEYFMNQFVMMESLARKLDLSSEDFSTVPGHRTLGIFHIRKLGLYEDEQLFKGLYEGLISIKASLVDQPSQMSCHDLHLKAQVDIQQLPLADPKVNGVFSSADE